MSLGLGNELLAHHYFGVKFGQIRKIVTVTNIILHPLVEEFFAMSSNKSSLLTKLYGRGTRIILYLPDWKDR